MAKRKTAEQRLAALIDEIGIERVESFVRFLKACGEAAGVKIASPRRSKTEQVVAEELGTAAEKIVKRARKIPDSKTMSAAGTDAAELFKARAAGAEQRIMVE